MTLTASADAGQTLRWYDAEFGGNLLVEGTSLNIPGVSESTTYWVEASQSTTGLLEREGKWPRNLVGSTTNSARWLEFDVLEPMRLVDVTLFANGTYDRGFEIIDAFGQVLWSTTVNVTDGEFLLPIGFDLEPGNEL